MSQPVYRYRLTNTGHSSARFGPCEVCNQHASEVWLQAEQCEYKPDHWTGYKCQGYFGHKECLESKRRSQKVEV